MYQQHILYGAPGTGKSHRVNEVTQNIPDSRKFRVTIHPEYSYSDFVGQILPSINENGDCKFVFKEGPLTTALKEAFKDSSLEVVLILEELSRGNVSAIFGDMFQLLDRDEHFVSKFPVYNKEISALIPEIIGNSVYFPSNLSILCTVNLSDQNVAPLDNAFKRRFTWEYIPIYPVKNQDGNTSLEHNPMIQLYVVNQAAKRVSWVSLYMALDRFIVDKSKGLGLREDRQIGQFFIYFSNKLSEDSRNQQSPGYVEACARINFLIKNKLLSYLWNDVQQHNFHSGATASLFKSDIHSFADLYEKWGKDCVFSDTFIQDFLKQAIDQYEQ